MPCRDDWCDSGSSMGHSSCHFSILTYNPPNFTLKAENKKLVSHTAASAGELGQMEGAGTNPTIWFPSSPVCKAEPSLYLLPRKVLTFFTNPVMYFTCSSFPWGGGAASVSSQNWGTETRTWRTHFCILAMLKYLQISGRSWSYSQKPSPNPASHLIVRGDK